MPLIKDPRVIERNTQRIYGCAFACALALNGGLPLRAPNTPALAYAQQRQASKKRGIGWEITFPEWLGVWLESGNWSLRGVGVGRFCMARHGDSGPYRVGNVSIILSTQNSRDAVYKPGRKHALPDPLAKLGTGRGWTIKARATRNPYQVAVGRQYIGSFPTQQEAEAAYAKAVAVRKGLVSHDQDHLSLAHF